MLKAQERKQRVMTSLEVGTCLRAEQLMTPAPAPTPTIRQAETMTPSWSICERPTQLCPVVVDARQPHAAHDFVYFYDYPVRPSPTSTRPDRIPSPNCLCSVMGYLAAPLLPLSPSPRPSPWTRPPAGDRLSLCGPVALH